MNDITIDNPQERLESDLNWLGGIIDGEGCITISSFWKRYNGESNFTASPIIQITNTNYNLISEVARIYKENEVRHHIAQTQPKAENTKIRYDVAIKGLERCKEACDILKPYIRIKKQQLNLVYDFCLHRILLSRNHPQTEKGFELIKQIRELNAKGSRILNDYTPNSIKNGFVIEKI